MNFYKIWLKTHVRTTKSLLKFHWKLNSLIHQTVEIFFSFAHTFQLIQISTEFGMHVFGKIDWLLLQYVFMWPANVLDYSLKHKFSSLIRVQCIVTCWVWNVRIGQVLVGVLLQNHPQTMYFLIAIFFLVWHNQNISRTLIKCACLCTSHLLEYWTVLFTLFGNPFVPFWFVLNSTIKLLLFLKKKLHSYLHSM